MYNFQITSKPEEGMVFVDTFAVPAARAMEIAREMATAAQRVLVFQSKKHGTAMPPHEGIPAFDTIPALDDDGGADPTGREEPPVSRRSGHTMQRPTHQSR